MNSIPYGSEEYLRYWDDVLVRQRRLESVREILRGFGRERQEEAYRTLRRGDLLKLHDDIYRERTIILPDGFEWTGSYRQALWTDMHTINYGCIQAHERDKLPLIMDWPTIHVNSLSNDSYYLASVRVGSWNCSIRLGYLQKVEL